MLYSKCFCNGNNSVEFIIVFTEYKCLQKNVGKKAREVLANIEVYAIGILNIYLFFGKQIWGTNVTVIVVSQCMCRRLGVKLILKRWEVQDVWLTVVQDIRRTRRR